MVIAWATAANPAETLVEFGLDASKLPYYVSGTRRPLITLGRTEYFHEATLTGLANGTKYFYRVGSQKGWSQVTVMSNLNLPKQLKLVNCPAGVQLHHIPI